MMTALSKNLVEAQVETAKGNWAIRDAHKQFELYGKKAGIIGLGRIGRDTASLCTAIGMKVAGYDPFLTKEQIEELGYEYYGDYEELLKDCDVISIHVPLTKDTENMIAAKQLKEMKNTAIIVNCSRGGIVNEADLIEALNNGEIAGAGLDVFVGEELHPGNPLLDAKLTFSSSQCSTDKGSSDQHGNHVCRRLQGCLPGKEMEAGSQPEGVRTRKMKKR